MKSATTMAVLFVLVFAQSNTAAFVGVKTAPSSRSSLSESSAFFWGSMIRRQSSAKDSDVDSLQQAPYQKELQSQQSSWLGSVSSLPFECTSCGKCCKTIGDVIMSPEETLAAATYVNTTVSEFIKNYASHTMRSKTKPEDKPWLLIANRETEKGPVCIFLDTNNQCQIYPVRPIQCSTYPFWSNILENEFNWNDEVRRLDDDLTSPTLRQWTPDDGGCEGMKLLDEENTSSAADGVPVAYALEQAALYEQSDQRLSQQGVIAERVYKNPKGSWKLKN
jgi:Fe-S-cluster containining protein